jgi:hypothetical protein
MDIVNNIREAAEVVCPISNEKYETISRKIIELRKLKNYYKRHRQ